MWLLYNTKQIHTPPQSPDVNPIENLWANLKLKVQEHKISSKNELKEIWLKEWSNIPKVSCRKLVESMPRRLQAVRYYVYAMGITISLKRDIEITPVYATHIISWFDFSRDARREKLGILVWSHFHKK